MIEKFEQMLEWQAAEAGRFVAPANAAFWAEWRADKAAVKALGISCKPGAGRDWQVSWKRDTAPTRMPEAACANYAPAYDATGGWVVPALDPSVPWSDEQLAICEKYRTLKGNLVIRARAGTGKTFTTIAAISQAFESVILYAIFGKRNQKEAEGKINDRRVSVKTLHALGFRFIRAVWPKAHRLDGVEWDRIETVIGTSAPDDVRRAIFKLVGFAKNLCVNMPSVEDLIQICEDRDVDAEAYEDTTVGGWTLWKLSVNARKVLELSMKPDFQNRICANDMVWLPVVMNWVRPAFQLVVVDEAQDMNAPQLEMACRASSGRVIIVGDDFQAIFGFRGAMDNSIDIMKARLNAVECGLTVTYRCPSSVVELVKKYVPDYQAAPNAPVGNIHSEAYESLMTAKPGDAILSRANAPLMPICLKLLRNGISARIEGRDVGAMLLALVNKMKAKSVPDYIVKVQAHGNRAIARLKNQKDSEAKIEAIQDQTETLIAIAEEAKNVQDIKDRCVALFEDSDKSPKPAVVLSTVHKAKGLEWSKVYLIASTFLRPGKETNKDEQKIFYVACTRTKNELIFVQDPQ